MDKKIDDIRTHKCPVCGKKFIPAPMHAYKTSAKSNKLLCTYSCMLEYDRRRDAQRKYKKQYEKGVKDK